MADVGRGMRFTSRGVNDSTGCVKYLALLHIKSSDWSKTSTRHRLARSPAKRVFSVKGGGGQVELT